ncbi:hypothetical protein KEM56_001231, partial [Ascosphaera pollenicola]
MDIAWTFLASQSPTTRATEKHAVAGDWRLWLVAPLILLAALRLIESVHTFKRTIAGGISDGGRIASINGCDQTDFIASKQQVQQQQAQQKSAHPRDD